jgi:hypothetical protein
MDAAHQDRFKGIIPSLTVTRWPEVLLIRESWMNLTV